MNVVLSSYMLVDGIFVSNFVGTDSLSAINIISVFLLFIIAIATMFSTGGNAIIAKNFGENNPEEARQKFTLLTTITIVLSFFIIVVGNLFLREIVIFLGANSTLIPHAESYLKTLLIFTPAIMLQMLFQLFFVTAGQSKLGLVVTFIAGISNLVFDFILIVVLNMGIEGSALATGLGASIPSIVGLLYFRSNRNHLYFTKPKVNVKFLTKTVYNGLSEMITGLSAAFITFVLNRAMMKYAGVDGVASITIILYTQFLLSSVFTGFSIALSPVISYKYGTNNFKEIINISKISILIVSFVSLSIFMICIVFDSRLIEVFVNRNTNVYDLAINGFNLFSYSYLFMGLNILIINFFTAITNSKTSFLLSLMRTFVFVLIGIIFLPKIFNIDGIWLSVPLAELLSIILSLFYYVKYWIIQKRKGDLL